MSELFDEEGNQLPPIPQRYIVGMGGDMVEAERRWRETCKWRRENNIDQILMEPQPHWDEIKANYPHFFHKRCKAGHLAYYEVCGEIKIKNLTRQGISIDQVLRQYIFLTEYCWKHLDPREDEGKLFTVMDLKGVSVSDLAGDAVAFLRQAAAIISEHYPERSFKIVIVNAPWWFNTIWKIVSKIVSPRTKEKLYVEGKNYKARLLEFVDEDSLPIRFGGRDPTPLFGSPEEAMLREHNRLLVQAAGPSLGLRGRLRSHSDTSLERMHRASAGGGGEGSEGAAAAAAVAAAAAPAPAPAAGSEEGKEEGGVPGEGDYIMPSEGLEPAAPPLSEEGGLEQAIREFTMSPEEEDQEEGEGEGGALPPLPPPAPVSAPGGLRGLGSAGPPPPFAAAGAAALADNSNGGGGVSPSAAASSSHQPLDHSLTFTESGGEEECGGGEGDGGRGQQPPRDDSSASPFPLLAEPAAAPPRQQGVEEEEEGGVAEEQQGDDSSPR